MKRLRILLADDQPLYRHKVRHAFEGIQDIQLVGEASDGQAAIKLADSLSPDVMMCDIDLPGLSGLETARGIRRRDPHIAVIVLTAHEDDDQLFGAIKAGAAAFSTKDIADEKLVDMVRRVGRGEYIINETVISRPFVAARVLKQFRDLAAMEPETEGIFAPLTSREIEILDCIARGMSNKEIARNLLISDQTVKNHITSILRKLAVNDRTQAVIYALRRGWIKLSDQVG
ncbi:MAG: response regulator transcription factor [Chloroflexota bacterium]|nr:response regulator transcription factor [Chloroflexota bacterium]